MKSVESKSPAFPMVTFSVLSLLSFVNRHKKKWNVRIEERYSHGEGVATYLARYMRGGAIKNRRIVSFDGQAVCFDYRDNRDTNETGKGKQKRMTLKIDQFIQRLLLHVPVGGKPGVRSYGLYSTSKTKELASIRKELGQAPAEKTRFMDWKRYTKDRGDQHPESCPICRQPLVSRMRFYRGQSPPVIPLKEAA